MFVRLPSGLFRVQVVAHRDDRKPENMSGIAIDDLTIRACDEYSRFSEVFLLWFCVLNTIIEQILKSVRKHLVLMKTNYSLNFNEVEPEVEPQHKS